MRKLNSKNKLLILGLSIFTFLVLSAVCVFIIFKIKDYNVKYEVSSISYLYNKDKELITVKNNSYIKKDFIGNEWCLHHRSDQIKEPRINHKMDRIAKKQISQSHGTKPHRSKGGDGNDIAMFKKRMK